MFFVVNSIRKMKTLVLSLLSLLFVCDVFAQTEQKTTVMYVVTSESIPQRQKSKIYTTSNFEFLFQGGDAKKDGKQLDEEVRFTIWFNYTQQLHFDLSNNIGFYTGGAIRNVGFITSNENIAYSGVTAETVKRRLYTLGVPLALKLGNFDKHFYVYGGGEMELAVAYKEKRWINGSKSIKTDWFGSETDRFLPSVFVGVQFPRGLNIQYKMYLNNFLNPKYGAGTAYDQSGFSKSTVQYISVSFNFGAEEWHTYTRFKSIEKNSL